MTKGSSVEVKRRDEDQDWLLPGQNMDKFAHGFSFGAAGIAIIQK
jgi:hypothetical protein